ncbi:hypothetical protein JL09_g6961 [Pichia kudriavzevii]|uniref:Uncharacterized protein n=1 Tax=Pichia kudriavzevii TaxID=4909 RepID=A0A099NKK8_PICKU|nr:hypothetical protein JL09_g6961 [Pichia kudriavzevii]
MREFLGILSISEDNAHCNVCEKDSTSKMQQQGKMHI